jgi:murein DD-endopeptidase MepM/ murein hydrolase activator NlpD
MYSTADGLVTFAGYFRGYGLLITIQHGLSYTTRYGHCSKLAVKAGDRVIRGQLIGYVGSTGHSTGPHVHYEVRQHEAAVNPMKFIREEW